MRTAVQPPLADAVAILVELQELDRHIHFVFHTLLLFYGFLQRAEWPDTITHVHSFGMVNGVEYYVSITYEIELSVCILLVWSIDCV